MSVRCKLLCERYFKKYQLRETTGSLVSKSKVLAERVVIAQLNNFPALCGIYMVFAMFIRAYHWVDPTHILTLFLKTILTLFFKDRFSYISPFVPRLCFSFPIPSHCSSTSFIGGEYKMMIFILYYSSSCST